ncbi:hypothetical protein ASE63_25975 [Bosea sp. Root381]|nr:hypothetical protein ASE63_25975 [Bosea sp. Root381]
MIITISPAGRGRFRSYLGTRLLCTSPTPFLSSARVLLREGVDPSTPLEMTREGSDAVDLRSTVGVAARFTVSENDHEGPVFRAYKAFPADLRSKPQELSPCA